MESFQSVYKYILSHRAKTQLLSVLQCFLNWCNIILYQVLKEKRDVEKPKQENETGGMWEKKLPTSQKSHRRDLLADDFV